MFISKFKYFCPLGKKAESLNKLQNWPVCVLILKSHHFSKDFLPNPQKTRKPKKVSQNLKVQGFELKQNL